MPEYITKISKKKVDGEIKLIEKTYRIDPDFVPTSTSDICVEFIENYCVAHDQIAWLVGELSTPRKQILKDGKERTAEITAIQLASIFYKKFFPKTSKSEETWVQALLKKYS